MAQKASVHLSPQEYVRLEEESDEKHEYFDGQAYLMSSGTPRHNLISANIIGELRQRVRGSGCRTMSSDQRIFIPAYAHYTYPDASVICGADEYDELDRTAITNPTLLVEVTSPRTAKYDLGEKFRRYQSLVSLQSYLRIAQDTAYIEHWQRTDPAQWLVTLAIGLDATIRIASLNVEIALALIYENVTFDADTPSVQS